MYIYVACIYIYIYYIYIYYIYIYYIYIYIYNLCACDSEMNNGHDQTQTHLDPSVPTNPRRWFRGQRAVPGARDGVHVDAAAVAAEGARAAGSQKPGGPSAAPGGGWSSWMPKL